MSEREGLVVSRFVVVRLFLNMVSFSFCGMNLVLVLLFLEFLLLFVTSLVNRLDPIPFLLHFSIYIFFFYFSYP